MAHHASFVMFSGYIISFYVPGVDKGRSTYLLLLAYEGALRRHRPDLLLGLLIAARLKVLAELGTNR